MPDWKAQLQNDSNVPKLPVHAAMKDRHVSAHDALLGSLSENIMPAVDKSFAHRVLMICYNFSLKSHSFLKTSSNLPDT